jgi:hypothetical protein
MIDSFTEIRNLLSREFTVEKIMVQTSLLISGTTPEDCEAASQENSDYDIIPFSQKDSITGYWEKKSKKIIPITPRHLISSSTSIFKLIDLFEKQPFFFVIKGPHIEGYVHVSDLNNDILKIPFYVLLQSLESKLLIQLQLGLEEISTLDNQERVKQILELNKNIRKMDVHTDIIQGLYLAEILELGIKRKILDIPIPLKHHMEDFRNRVSHAAKPLVKRGEEVSHLRAIKDFCLDFLSN